MIYFASRDYGKFILKTPAGLLVGESLIYRKVAIKNPQVIFDQ